MCSSWVLSRTFLYDALKQSNACNWSWEYRQRTRIRSPVLSSPRAIVRNEVQFKFHFASMSDDYSPLGLLIQRTIGAERKCIELILMIWSDKFKEMLAQDLNYITLFPLSPSSIMLSVQHANKTRPIYFNLTVSALSTVWSRYSGSG